MERDPKKVFSRTFTTKSRRDAIDPDYLDKLSPEELAWYAKFTEEYYGASFQLNAAFAIRTDVIALVENEIPETKTAKQKEKWTEHLARLKRTTGKYVQVSENQIKSHDIDLRKCRKVQLYYINENGNFSKNDKYKYSTDNIANPNDLELRKDYNDRVDRMKRCLLNSGNRILNENDDFDNYAESVGAESLIIRYEDECIADDIQDSTLGKIMEYCYYCGKMTETIDIRGGDCKICKKSKNNPR